MPNGKDTRPAAQRDAFAKFVGVVVTAVWAFVVIDSRRNGIPVDWYVHAMMGGIVGTVFGFSWVTRKGEEGSRK